MVLLQEHVLSSEKQHYGFTSSLLTCYVGCAVKGNFYIVTVFKILIIYFSIPRSGEVKKFW